jgi:hypothetical protein
MNMRRTITSWCLAGALLFGAGSASAEVLRDTLMLRAKDSQARVVSIGGEVYHLSSDTELVSGGLGGRAKLGKPLTLAEIPVPETAGAVVPAGEPGVRVKYAYEIVGGQRVLRSVVVFAQGSRAH